MNNKASLGFRAALLAAACAVLVSNTSAADLDLFVTDYNENPTPEQRPLIDQPLVFPGPREVKITTVDGKTVNIPSPLGVQVRQAMKGDPRQARLFAAPGEFEPFSLLLRPKQSLKSVSFQTHELRSSGQEIIPAANVAVHSVESFHGSGRDILVPLGTPWNMPANSTEFFWCTIHVPRTAKPGTYRGDLEVNASGNRVGAIQIVIDVLPVTLSDPPFSLGLNYSKRDDDPGGRILAAQLRDMREHGMTCVAPLYNWHQPVHDQDTSELGALLEAYKAAGFPGVFYWAAPMDLQLTELAGYGDETSRRWQQKYIKVMRLMHTETRKHGVPTLFSIGDELTNKGMEGVRIAGRLARFVWEELPEIATTSDMNGYREVMAMSPYLNVATFNNGWDGADHHNEQRRLLNRAFLEELQSTTGAIPWFVNAGSTRFAFGFFFWKMSHYGVKGKVEWYYNLGNEQGSLVRTQKDAIYSTLDYERCREGIDDLKYLCALERELAKASPELPQTKEARALLLSIQNGIVDDWSLYEGRSGQRFPDDGFARLDPEKVVSFGKLNSLRWELAKALVALQSSARNNR